MEETTNEITEPIEIENDENNTVDEMNDIPDVRRSTRPRKQRMDINQEEIEDCDDKTNLTINS